MCAVDCYRCFFTLLVCIRVSLIGLLYIAAFNCIFAADCYHCICVDFVLTFIIGFPYFLLMICIIDLINCFHCTKATALSPREIGPAECAKGLNNKTQHPGAIK